MANIRFYDSINYILGLFIIYLSTLSPTPIIIVRIIYTHFFLLWLLFIILIFLIFIQKGKLEMFELFKSLGLGISSHGVTQLIACCCLWCTSCDVKAGRWYTNYIKGNNMLGHAHHSTQMILECSRIMPWFSLLNSILNDSTAGNT
jgi:hypothetical protein